MGKKNRSQFIRRYEGMMGKNNPSYKHGMRNSEIYDIYNQMKGRVHNKKNPFYHNYGGRGIKILWETFLDFQKDMYSSYKNHIKKYGRKNTTIERIDNNGDYCKTNCRWATRKEQSRNRRSNHLITYKGNQKTMIEWSEEIGINFHTLKDRINRYGWSIKKALVTGIICNKHKIEQKKCSCKKL